MPSFVSKDGIWEAAHEYVVDPKAPKGKEIYDGPDRAATEMMKSLGVDHLGQHFKMDPELKMRSHQMGYTSIDEYLKAYGYDQKKAEEAYLKSKEKGVVRQDCYSPDSERKPAPLISGGGVNTAPGAKPESSRYGGYEHPSDAPGGKAN